MISKREKTIITLAVLAALYAGGQFLFSGKSQDADRSGVEEKPAEEFMMEVAQSLAVNRLTETEKTILEKAEAPWPSQPFVQTGSPSEARSDTPSETSGAAAGSFSYTGCIEAGNRRLAIINGTEYEVGDQVADSLLTVRGISFEQVTLENGEGTRYMVPLQNDSDRSTTQISLQSE